MSHEAMKSFMKQAAGDTALAERFRDAVARSEEAEAMAAIARVATGAGYLVDVADVSAFRTQMLDTLDDGELSDDSLNTVSGGIIGVDDLLIAGALASAATLPALGVATGALGASVVGIVVSQDVRNFFSKW